MKLYVHFCAFGFSNCYILGDGNEAIIVDPANMDEAILKNIEDNDYILIGVLITHGHLNHVHGLNTLMRVYDTDIYSISPDVRGHKTIPVRDGETIRIGNFIIEVIAAPGHSADSAVFKVDNMLFTGDAMTAGLIGRTASVYAAANQMTALRGKILSLPGDYSVFPGHGPPSSLDAERRFNYGVNAFEDYKNRHNRFRPELD